MALNAHAIERSTGLFEILDQAQQFDAARLFDGCVVIHAVLVDVKLHVGSDLTSEDQCL